MAGIWRCCASGECLQPLDGFGFLLDPERVVEFVEEAAEGDAQRQLDDLRFAEMAAEPGEEGIRDAVQVFQAAIAYSTTSLSLSSNSGWSR